MRLVIISDTHNYHTRLTMPDGDLLIHAGDMTNQVTLHELGEFNRWLGTLSYRHKVVISGNHDWCWQRENNAARAILTNAVYLEDSGTTIDGVRLWGSPWQPEFHDFAFNLPRGAPLREKWAQIPTETDILITHGPPHGHGDLTIFRQRAGCADLRDAVSRVKPRLHIFGHIHEGFGITEQNGTTFVNASVCLPFNRPTERVMVVDWGTL
jgi:Icc-related predicted phosphoesterase